jgi:hypothetical protein
MTDTELKLVDKLYETMIENLRLYDEVDRLWTANAELCVERDATDALLGHSIDLLKRLLDGEAE